MTSTRRPLREVARDYGLVIVLLAASPRLTRWQLAPYGHPGRKLVYRAAARALLIFATLQWVGPWVRRRSAEVDGLKQRLGREPTQDEFADHFDWKRPTQ